MQDVLKHFDKMSQGMTRAPCILRKLRPGGFRRITFAQRLAFSLEATLHRYEAMRRATGRPESTTHDP